MTTFGKVKKRIELSPPYLVFSLISIMRWLAAAKETDENTGK
jgi:hypothetical protein